MVSEVKSRYWDESLQHFIFLITTHGFKLWKPSVKASTKAKETGIIEKVLEAVL